MSEATPSTDYMLFLDDERTPPKEKDVFGWEVVHAKNIREFIAAIRTRGAPAMIAFDWYLGAGEPDGLEAARWLTFHDEEEDVIREDLIFYSQSSDKLKAREISRLIAEYIAKKYGKDDPDDLIRAGRRKIPRETPPPPPHLRRS
jgi:hypothetical protein|nr:cyclic-phosphate processing receiver domain-containing protein [Neorhizobium tomejilense]